MSCFLLDYARAMVQPLRGWMDPGYTQPRASPGAMVVQPRRAENVSVLMGWVRLGLIRFNLIGLHLVRPTPLLYTSYFLLGYARAMVQPLRGLMDCCFPKPRALPGAMVVQPLQG